MNTHYPPLTEQKRIVARLDAAFAEIDKAIAAAKCKQVQTDGLKSAFLSTELSIADNQDVAAMWQTVKLSDVCTIQPAKREVKSELTDDSLVSFMGMSSLGIGRKYSSSCEVRKLKDVYKSYTYFKENDVLLAKITPCFENGKLGIAKDLSNGTGFGSSEFVVLRCSETLLPEYLYYFFLQPDFRSEGKKNMSGAVGQKRVSKDYIENTSIPLPPLTEQKRIVAKLDAVFEQADTVTANVQKQLNEYRSLKSSLLANMLVREAA